MPAYLQSYETKHLRQCKFLGSRGLLDVLKDAAMIATTLRPFLGTPGESHKHLREKEISSPHEGVPVIQCVKVQTDYATWRIKALGSRLRDISRVSYSCGSDVIEPFVTFQPRRTCTP